MPSDRRTFWVLFWTLSVDGLASAENGHGIELLRRKGFLSVLLAKNATKHYRYAMNHRNSSFLRALLLLILAIGPLQAQSVFACAMMDTVVHDGCCCDDHKATEDCANSNCGATLESSGDPCCERSVELSVDQEASQDTLVVKHTEVRSDADPPQALVSSFDAPFPPHPFLIPGIAHHLAAAGQSGSDTYLITLRLRI